MKTHSTVARLGWLSFPLAALAVVAGCSSAPADDGEATAASHDAYSGVSYCVVPEGGDPFIPMTGWKCAGSGFNSARTCDKSNFSGQRSCQDFIGNAGGGKSYGLRNGPISSWEDDGEVDRMQYELGTRQECTAEVCSGYNWDSRYEVWTGRWASEPIYRERAFRAYSARDLTPAYGTVPSDWSEWKLGWPAGY